ncbi:(Fe-S)-binding protein [Catenulispora rubra]|uniref:(Fe-S)-binding protein n=1 Tax=Catenulispora rubra TaxID=280293 RepID=UPI0018926DBA|nr:heterodisulfide reductase-related iron-sulfur binding cluster [Catenulispora rubra]
MGENLDDLTAKCVHCGFCLPACPTYALTGDENDSPRGRIHLMRQVIEGKAELDDSVSEHIDSCLGCLSCVSACPSGVQYDRIIEEFRPEVEQAYAEHRGDRAFRELVFGLFPHPARLRVAALGAVAYRRTGGAALVRSSGLLRRFPKLGAMEALMPDTTLRKAWSRLPASNRPRGERRATVAMISGCVQRVFFSDVNAATARVLQAEGCHVVVPEQGCCGALSLHAGREEEAKRYARRLIDVFRRPASASSATVALGNLDAVVVNVAGCGSTLKQYGELLADDPDYAEPAAEFAAKIRDVSEVLADLEPRAERHPIEARVAYHDACHLAHGQGVRAQPRKLLNDIPGLEVVEPAEAAFCCGSAGVHNLVRPEAAEELGRRKAERVRATNPDLVATGNPGCLLQIQRHLGDDTPVLHPIEIIDASIRGLRLNPRRVRPRRSGSDSASDSAD